MAKILGRTRKRKRTKLLPVPDENGQIRGFVDKMLGLELKQFVYGTIPAEATVMHEEIPIYGEIRVLRPDDLGGPTVTVYDYISSMCISARRDSVTTEPDPLLRRRCDKLFNEALKERVGV